MNFKSLYASIPPRLTEDIFPFFEIEVQYNDKIDRYAVQHAMLRSSGDPNMDSWAREKKLFPWVAVAALLKVRLDTTPMPLFRTRTELDSLGLDR